MEKDCIVEWNNLRKRGKKEDDTGMDHFIWQLSEKEMSIRGLKDKMTMAELLEGSSKRLGSKMDRKRLKEPQHKFLKREEEGEPRMKDMDWGISSDGKSSSTSREDAPPVGLGPTTSHSFKGRGHAQKWKDRDTRLFFRALSMFGTDFSMVALLFPGRDRAHLINKYHKEEKDNPKKVEAALQTHKRGGSQVLRRCERVLNEKPKEELIRRGSGSSLDSLDQLIFEELDAQFGPSRLRDSSTGSFVQPS